jgi:hypothetical protein
VKTTTTSSSSQLPLHPRLLPPLDPRKDPQSSRSNALQQTTAAEHYQKRKVQLQPFMASWKPPFSADQWAAVKKLATAQWGKAVEGCSQELFADMFATMTTATMVVPVGDGGGAGKKKITAPERQERALAWLAAYAAAVSAAGEPPQAGGVDLLLMYAAAVLMDPR